MEPRPDAKANQRISSLLKKPEKGGTPEMARVAMRNVMAVIGMNFLSPP